MPYLRDPRNVCRQRRHRWHLRLGLVIPGLVLLVVVGAGLRFDVMSSRPMQRAAFADPLAHLPRVMLWAWERREDLSFVDQRRVGVAYLARSVQLRDDDVLVRPRMQPLRVPDGTTLVAVVHVESDRERPPRRSESQQRTLVDAIAAATTDRVVQVQVDFDATLSERSFYRDVLIALRERLPPSIGLSITALASWCVHDLWLSGLPIDEAVPMLFRMGVDDRRIRAYLDSGRDFRSGVCRKAIGLATDEPFPARSWAGRRIYVFHPRSWSSESVGATLGRLRAEP